MTRLGLPARAGQPPSLVADRRARRHGEHVDVAVRPEPAEHRRAVEVRTDEAGAEDVPQGGENLLDLALHER